MLYPIELQVLRQSSSMIEVGPAPVNGRRDPDRRVAERRTLGDQGERNSLSAPIFPAFPRRMCQTSPDRLSRGYKCFGMSAKGVADEQTAQPSAAAPSWRRPG